MQDENDMPLTQGARKNGSGWLREPAWENAFVGDIGSEKAITPELLKVLEGALSASPKRGGRPTVQTSCGVLEQCGVFKGDGPGSCQKLTKCDSYS